MARIVLTVESNTSKALQGITALKTQVNDLANQLSNIKVNKALTAQITELSKYYQSLASAGKTVLESQAKVEAALKKSGTTAKSTATNIETLRKQYANLLSQIKSLEKQYPAKTFDSTKTSVEQTYKEVTDLSAAYRSNAKTADEVNSEAARLSQTYKTLAADVAALKVGNEKLAVSDPFSTKTGDSIARLQKRYQSLLTTIQSAEKYYPKGTFDSLTESVKQQITALNGLGNEYKQTGALSEASQKQLNGLSSVVLDQEAAFAQAKNSAKNYHGTLRDTVSGFLKFQVSAMLVMKPLQLLQSAISSINETLVETEKSVVSLQRVLDETVASGEISSELYQIAINLGQTFDNVQEIAQNFAKAGLSWQDTLEATEAAVLALNVAELTAKESSEGLIAVMQQFHYEASELTYVIDVLNKAADKSAVDTADLLVALQKTGSYAAAANLSLEETVGLIAALSKATAASGQNIGNALKSLFAYSSKASSLEMFASLSDEMKAIVDMYEIGNASILDVWEGLADTMTNLSDAQADLLEQWSSESGLETELGSALGDVYEQMSGVWDTAGVYRKNYFIALLNNFDEVYDVMGELSDAAGYTAEEQAKYMDTYEAKLNALNSQWQAMVSDENGWLAFKKFWVDIASGVLTVIDYFGGLQTAVLALSTVLWVAFGDKIINAVKSFGTALKGLITGFTSAASAASAFQAALGWIGIAATAISLIGGAITSSMEAAEQAAEEARQAAIDSWNAVSDEAAQLSELYKQYLQLSQITDKTAEQQDEWVTIQENIVDLLGEQAIQLGGLTEGTEEYRQKLIELTQTELQYYAMRAQAASNAYEEEFNALSFDTDLGNQVLGHIYKTDRRSGQMFEKGDYDLYEALLAAGYDIGLRAEHDGVNPYGDMYFDAKLDNLSVYEQSDKLFEMAEYLFNNGGGNSDLYDAIFSAYEVRLEAINERIAKEASEAVYGYIAKNGFVDTQAEFDEIVNRIMESTGATEDWRDEIEGLVSDYSGFNKELEETGDNLDDQIKKISTLQDETIDKLIDDLKEIRDLEDQAATLEEKRLDIAEAREALAEAETQAAEDLAKVQEKAEEARLDLLEKQQAVLEAQKALEEARNNRSVWRYNQSTGQFEWVADESAIKDAEEELQDAKDDEEDARQDYLDALADIKEQQEDNAEAIANAQESLQDAIDAFNEYIKGQAWDDVISELESGNATNDSIKEILDNWKATAETQAEADTEWYQKIIDAIKNSVDVDITISENTASDTETGTDSSRSKLLERIEQAASAARKGDNSQMLALLEEAGLNNDSGKKLAALYLQENKGPLISALESSGAFDSGGIASGAGFIAKATSEPETVNYPELTAKILSPVSNAQFDRYVRDMGILFETAKEYTAMRPMVQSTVGNTTTNNTDNSINLNNIKIGSEMLSQPFGKVLGMFGIVPKKS